MIIIEKKNDFAGNELHFFIIQLLNNVSDMLFFLKKIKSINYFSYAYEELE